MEGADTQNLVKQVIDEVRRTRPLTRMDGDPVEHRELVLNDSWRQGDGVKLTAIVRMYASSMRKWPTVSANCSKLEVRERTTARQADDVNQAFRSLDELMEDPEIFFEVQVNEDDFDRAYLQIDRLDTLKQLHALLHDLQERVFVFIDVEVQNAIEEKPIDWHKLYDPASSEMSSLVPKIQRCQPGSCPARTGRCSACSRPTGSKLASEFEKLMAAVRDGIDNAVPGAANWRERPPNGLGRTSRDSGIPMGSVDRTTPTHSPTRSTARVVLDLDRLADALGKLPTPSFKGVDPDWLVDVGQGMTALRACTRI